MQLRNAVDSVTQHRHLSETVSEPSTLDRPAACSAERIFPFFNCLQSRPTTRTSWYPKCLNPNCLSGSVNHGGADIMLFKTRRVHIGLSSLLALSLLALTACAKKQGPSQVVTPSPVTVAQVERRDVSLYGD